MRAVMRVLNEVCVKRVSYKCVCEGSPSRRRSHNKAGFSKGGSGPGLGPGGGPGPGGGSGGGPGPGGGSGGGPGPGGGSGGGPGGIPAEHSWLCGSSAAVLSAVCGSVQVLQNFISEEEEVAFLQELDAGLKKKRYEFDHWDDAIHGFRETERLQWGGVCAGVLERLRAVAFPEGSPLLGPVHVLDLDKAGFIKPHVDSLKFCGSTIAGLSLLSDSVMRLVREDNSADWVALLLRRRSLYILSDEARFKFTHEILKDEDSFFSGRRIPRNRRISVICRNLPL